MFLKNITYCPKCQLAIQDKKFFGGIYYEHLQDGIQYLVNIDNKENPAIGCWDCLCQFLADNECFFISLANYSQKENEVEKFVISIDPKIKHPVLNPVYKIFVKIKQVLFRKFVKQNSIINQITKEVPHGNT